MLTYTLRTINDVFLTDIKNQWIN